MGKAAKLERQVFGRLTVLSRVGLDKHKKVIWECACDCGAVTRTSTAHLRSGHSTSCGCFRIDRVKNSHKSLVGKVFGRLTVLEKIDASNGHRRWLCSSRASPEAHHLWGYAHKTAKVFRFLVENGVTLCHDCHMEFHFLFGRDGQNTEFQYNSFAEFKGSPDRRYVLVNPPM
jgi:hypothetical protein